MLTARKYTHPVTLIFTPTAQDDYGKDVAGEPIEVLRTFAGVVQTSNYKQKIAGESAAVVAMRFTIRYTALEFTGVMYKGDKYVVLSVDNVNQADRELVITAQKAE